MPMKLHRDNFRWSNGRGHNQKPILVAQKKDNYGLGKQVHPTDQWWLNAFDSQLKSLDVSTSAATGKITVEQTQTNNPLSMSIKSRYYIRFVRGGLLKGEIEEKVEKVEVREETATPGGTDDELRAKRSKEEKRAEKEEKRKRKAERAAAGKGKKGESKEKSKNDKDDGGKAKKRKSRSGKEETKEERRERKRLKRLLAKEMAALEV